MGTKSPSTISEPFRYECPECESVALKPVTGKYGEEHKWRCDVCYAKLKMRWDKKLKKLVS